MAGTLYTYPENFRAFKALIAAQYTNTKITIAPDFVFGESNKTENFLEKFPTGKVPAFETSDGQCLTESNAIALYLSNEKLRGKTNLEQAQILQWISFAESEILPSSCAWVFPLLGIMPYNKNNVERAKEDVKIALTVLNKKLLDNTFLVGERISLADIIVFCNLLHLYQYVLEPSFRAPFGCVTRWFNTILNQKEVLAIVTNYKICEKVIEFDPKKYAAFQAKTSGGGGGGKVEKKKEDKKPAQQQQQQQQQKKEKKAKEPEPEAELDLADEALAAEPKSKDPFESMEKGTFVMDDFKRSYSNEEEAVSIAHFWEHFDPVNYSIWFGEYKYNDELTKVFMSCNLISGMYQRLDKMRKHSFASMCLFGEDNNSTISGIWIWRGHELAFTLSPDWQIDYDCYNWVKLDPASDDTKQLVKDYLSWTGSDKGGRKFNQGKIFK